MMSNRRLNSTLKYSNYLFVLLLGMFFFSPTTHGQTFVSIPLEQAFNISGSLDQEKQKGHYVLEALEVGNPMPTDQATYSVELLGNERKTIEGFNFSQEGTFSYNLYQQVPKNTVGFTYDAQVYLITVYVTRSVNGLDVEVTVKNDQKLKVESAAFTNIYVANSNQEKEDHTSGSLPNTEKENGNSLNRAGRLPRTGQLKENSWVIGFLILIFALELYRRKYQSNHRK